MTHCTPLILSIADGVNFPAAQISRKCYFLDNAVCWFWYVVWDGMLPLILLKYHQIQYILERSSSISIYTSIGKIINNLFCVLGWSWADSREVSRRRKHLWVMSWSWQAAAPTKRATADCNECNSKCIEHLPHYWLNVSSGAWTHLLHCCCCC